MNNGPNGEAHDTWVTSGEALREAKLDGGL